MARQVSCNINYSSDDVQIHHFTCNNSVILEIMGGKISKNEQKHYASSKMTPSKTYVQSVGFSFFSVHLCPLLVQPTSLKASR